jgi:hypothetical protein
MNSQHQWWSYWRFEVSTPKPSKVTVEEIKVNISRLTRKVYSSTTQARINKLGGSVFIVEVRSEGHPCFDPDYQRHVLGLFEKLFRNGFGEGTAVKLTTKLLSGNPQDGRPVEQAVMLPRLEVVLG